MTKKELTTQDQAAWFAFTLDQVAEDLYGEFGYDTCDFEQKKSIIKEIIERGWMQLT